MYDQKQVVLPVSLSLSASQTYIEVFIHLTNICWMLSIGWDWGALGIFREIRTARSEGQHQRKVTKYLWGKGKLRSIQFSSVAQSCPTLCDPMNRSTPGLPVHHQLPEFTQTHVHRVSDAIQPSHPLSSPSPPAPNPSQHQSLFQWVNSSHEVAKVLEFQL